MRKAVYISFFVFGILVAHPLRAQDLDSLRNLMDSMEVLHQSLAEVGDMEGAAKALYQYNDAAFLWQNQFDSAQVEEMKEKYQLDVRAAEIEVEEARLANQVRIILLSLGVGGLIVLALLLVRRMVGSRAKKEAERFEEKQLRKKFEARLQAEKLAQSELENAQLAENLKLQKQRLSSQMLQLLNKNQLLLHIQEKADNMESQTNFWEDLRSEIQEQIQPEEDWAAFLKQFEQLYPYFFSWLKGINPKLSEKDLKLAVLLRVQLSSKEIAYLLGLTPDSVKTARYRLSKKLALGQGEKLQDFLMQGG